MDDEFVDFYRVLGVSATATQEEITRAFREKCRDHHPDRTKNPKSHELQKLINHAYEVLSDPKTRSAFDKTYRERGKAMNPGLPSVPRPNRSSQSEQGMSGAGNQSKVTKSPMSRPWSYAPIVLALVAGIILASAAITAFRRPPSVKEEAMADEETLLAKKRLLEAEEAVRELEARSVKRKQESSIAAAKLRAIQLEGDKVLAAVKGLESELDKWEIEISPLLGNERGKLLTSNDDDVRAFEAIWTAKRPTKAEAKAIRERVSLVLVPINDELLKAEPHDVSGTSVSGHLATESATIDTLIQEVRGARLQVEHLLSAAELAPKKTSVATLEQAIKNLATREAKEKNTRIAEIERVNREKIAEAEAKLAEVEGASKVGAVEAKTARAKLDAAAEVEHQKLLQQAKSAETRALLSFFFTPGYWQPDGSQTTTKVPMSYSKLDGAGALDPTPDGLRALLLILVSGHEKVRPVWDEFTYVEKLSEQKRERLAKMQKTLIELGPTLVELKLLEP